MVSSLSSNHFLFLPRWQSTCPNHPSMNFVQILDFRLQNKWGHVAVSRKKIAENLAGEEPTKNHTIIKMKTTGTSKQSTSQTRKKPRDFTPKESSELMVTNVTTNEEPILSASSEGSKKAPRTRKKASPGLEEEKTEKKVRRNRNTERMDEDVEDQGGESEISKRKMVTFVSNVERESDLKLGIIDEDDIRCTYGVNPLVCCFGAAQHAFVPSGRPANRLADYQYLERMKDAIWSPENFVRAPGGCAGSVAIALAKYGGKVAFMGKLGNDVFGRAMLQLMNVSKVQTRSVRIDNRRATAVSQMKIAKRGHLKMTCVKPCAEDSLLTSEINIDVLQEAKMFYFTTHSLLDKSMRSTTLEAIKISKKSGGIIFYDINLPLPLWNSIEKTKLLIGQVWNLANIIELTKQELEFLCGIKPTEEFNNKNNCSSKFAHYGPEVVNPLWHENLEVLFVTNGISKVHYYTREYHGAVSGTEDVLMSPFTCDMSASGDGIVAGLMRRLVLQPKLIPSREYLINAVKYAIVCGIIDQWQVALDRGLPPKEGMDVEPDENGLMSMPHKQYRTIVPSAENSEFKADFMDKVAAV